MSSNFIMALIISMLYSVLWLKPAYAEYALTTCAIRWDAWYTNGLNDPGHFSAATLSPDRWHSLAPINAQFDTAGHITWSTSQAIFDKEIISANKANLCWAYVMYGTNNNIDLSNPLMKGLMYHRSSNIKNKVNYTMIITSGLLGRYNNYSNALSSIEKLMHDSNYQHLEIHGESRPLLFLLFSESDLDNYFSGSFSKMKNTIDALRRLAIDSGVGDPYIVILGGKAEAELARRSLGADAISEYISGKRNGNPETWSSFIPSIEDDWNKYAAFTTAAAIPTLRSGADIRARCETPPPYDHRFIKAAQCLSYVSNPTMLQLKSEFHDADVWVQCHPHSDPARLLLVYSWSECDESGNCLMPTVGDPTGEKLKAISTTTTRRK